MHVQEMISRHPDVRGATNDTLIRCIEACYDCAQACVACADACLAEDDVGPLKQCIRLDLDCARICMTTGAIASQRTGSDEALIKQMLLVCEAACARCEAESRHCASREHCRTCAEVCHACRDACREAAATITPG